MQPTPSPAAGRSPLSEFLSLAWPTVLTMLSYTLMQFVDAIMVAQVGPDELAAQGNGGVWGFVPLAFLFGVLTVVNTFVSQSMGAKRPQDVARYGWAGVWFAVLCWALVLVPFAMILPWMFAQMGHTPRITELETAYSEVLIYGCIVTLLAKAFSNFFFGIHRPRVIAVAAIVGNIVNVVLSYALIFGEQGLPSAGLPGVPGVQPMGVVGAAIGTLLGTFAEMLVPACIFLGKRMNQAYGIHSAWRPDWRAIRDLLRIGLPAGLQPGCEIFTWAIFMTLLVGHFGDTALTAGWITLRFMHLAFMPAIGFSVATTSMVGKYIGAQQPDTAAQRVRVALGVTMTYMGVCGLAMFVFREQFVGFFAHGAHTSAEKAAAIIALGGPIMIAAAFFQVFDGLGIVLIGALRGAGDTLWPGLVTVVLSWGVIVGVGSAAVHFVPQWGPLGPWLGASLYIILFGGFMLFRWRTGAWRKIRLLKPTLAEDAARIAPLEMGIPDLQPNLAAGDIAEGLQRARDAEDGAADAAPGPLPEPPIR